MKNITYINAGAGSGKTYTLTKKLVELIEKGKARPDQVILTTFTTKAASEFKQKAKEFLFTDNRVDDALKLEHAVIGTVHSICYQFINKYWYVLGLSPDMDVMDEEDADTYLSQSVADLPTEEEISLLQMFARQFNTQKKDGFVYLGIDENFWQSDLKKIIEFTTNYEIGNYELSKKKSIEFIRRFVDERRHVEITDELLDRMLTEARTYVSNSNRIKKKDDYFKKFKEIERGKYDKTIAWHLQVAKVLLSKYGDTCASVGEALQYIWNSPEVFRLQERYINLLFDLAYRWREMYTQFKREKNILDYNDMEKYMLQLLLVEDIALSISESYRYLFVDEFQDSSPIQVKIFDRLSDLMAHSYWVGDYKQSVYRFRGSDIDLIKSVVDRVTSATDSCDTLTLDKSYRSLPPIVDLCNNVFGKTFSGVLSQDNIRLNPNRDESPTDSLRYFWADDENALVTHIATLIGDGFSPNEIAVIALRNEELLKIATELKNINIPASRMEVGILESNLWRIVSSLLRVVDSPRDTLSKATVALLLDEDYDTKRIIEERILSLDKDVKNENFLSESPLIAKLMKLSKKLQMQSVGHLMKSLAVELNLFDELKHVETPDFVSTALQTIINLAESYETRCVQLNIPSTTTGFISYVENRHPSCSGNPEGVQLHTYHSCKGLQWKVVILTSLNAHPADEKKLVKNEIYGVHFDHIETPSAENQYPEVFVRLTPWIFGPSSVADSVFSIIVDTQEFKKNLHNSVAEYNRLLYVGMTRAADVLVLHLLQPKKDSAELLQWFKDVGIDDAASLSENGGCWDLLSTGHLFSNVTVSSEDCQDFGIQDYKSIDKHSMKCIKMDEHDCESFEPRYISPSQIKGKGMIKNLDNFNIRIFFAKRVPDWSIVGNCIHHIFGLMDSPIMNATTMSNIIREYHLEETMTDLNTVRTAWDNFQNFLKDKFGDSEKVYHELPFRLEREGQTVVGSIDYVYQTKEGLVLIDFKTCPMGIDAVLDKDSQHFAGLYSGQLDAYQDALEADGKNVIARYIYYPVSGLMVEVGNALNFEIPNKEDIFHIYGIEDITLDALIDSAVKYCDDDDFSGEIGWQEYKSDSESEDSDNDETKCAKYHLVLRYASAQGIDITFVNDEKPNIHITLPYLASIGDVKLLWGLLKALRENNPDCEILHNGHEEDGQLEICQDNYDVLVVKRLQNMVYLVAYCHGDSEHIAVEGFHHSLMLPTVEDYPEMELTDLAFEAMNKFIAVQWDYDDCEDAARLSTTDPDGDESVIRIVSNAADTFVGICQKVGVYIKETNDLKLIATADFKEQIKGNPFYEDVDYSQFVLRKMSQEDWLSLYNSLDGEVVGENSQSAKRVYVLRWNPAISSYRLEQYAQDREEFPHGWTSDWSIYEWQEAKKGDFFVMMRVGDENPGIVFYGDFASDPYQSKDWRGSDILRHYIDMNCFDPTDPNEPPILSCEELYAVLPEVDWLHGHSGELLSPSQGQKLMEILSDKLGLLPEDGNPHDNQ